MTRSHASHPSPSAAAREVAEQGWTILRDAVDPGLVALLVREIDRLLVELAVPFGTNEFVGLHTRRIFNLLARAPGFERVPVHPAVLAVVEAVLDDECLLSSLTAIEMGPGETEQPIHADDGSYALPRPHPPFTCTAIWALSEFTRENGGTRVVPGSHRRDRAPKRSDRGADATVPIEMSAGSVFVYHGSLWHGGGANTTGVRRMGIIANYCAGFLRQEENQLLALPRERVAGFEPRLQRLVGYGTYRGLLGHVDQKSPQTLVKPDAETDMVWRRIKA